MNENQKLIKFLDFPAIPNSMLCQVADIVKNGVDELHKFVGSDYEPYKLLPIKGELLEWLYQNLPIKFGSCVHIHTITSDLLIHKDYQIDRYKLNYIFDTGGFNVLTHFYDDNYSLLETYHLDKNIWHQFDGQIYHNVTNVESKRIAITIGTDTSLF